jgi:manganese-dependent inorganic pyrophosphatase
MDTIVVTTYVNPDLDGFACSVALTEFLNKTGQTAVMKVFGKPTVEVEYLLERFGLKIQEDAAVPLDHVVLVDTSEILAIDKSIKPENVIEIIDHRKINDAALFKNAKVQVEPVGSAATLIAEKYEKTGTEISIKTATLLYGAIVSNTLNFRANVTTDRDRRMAEWLGGKLELPEQFIEEMFRAKSDVSGVKLGEKIEADFAVFNIGGQKVGIGQLEITDVKKLIETRKPEIMDILQKLKFQEKLDKVFLSCIDLGEEFNAFVALEPATQQALSSILHVSFEQNVAYREGFIMRKEIIPLLKEKSY